jgi:hypothetical protein
MTATRPTTDEPPPGSRPRWLEPETVSVWNLVAGCALLVLLVLACGYIAVQIWVAIDADPQPVELPATSAGPAPAAAGNGGLDVRPDVGGLPPPSASAVTPNGDDGCTPGRAALGLCRIETPAASR